MSNLRILVPVKRVLDYALKPRIKAPTRIDLSNLKHSLNPFDELAIEEAVRLRERLLSSSSSSKVVDILTVSAGPAKAQDVLRTALAMGADRALHIVVPEGEEGDGGAAQDAAGEHLEPLMVAKLLARIVGEENINLVLCGKQSISDDSGQVGSMLAGLLGWACATQIAQVSFSHENGTEAQVTREVDGGAETLQMRIPMVLTTDLRLNQPRYASLPNIMKAKKKELRKVNVADYFVGKSADEWKRKRLRIVSVAEPAKRQGGVKVESVDAMIAKLKELGAL